MAENRTFFYARVSSTDQHLNRQIDAFLTYAKAHSLELTPDSRDIITDKQSGKDLERAGYQTLKNGLLRKGDTLVIKSLDRLSRTKEDIKNELKYFKEKGIKLRIIDLPTTLDEKMGNDAIADMVNNIMIEVLSTIAEQERASIRKRQAEGIASAKARGKHLGRPICELPANWNEVIEQWKNHEITARKAIQLTGLKTSTFYLYVRQGREEA